MLSRVADSIFWMSRYIERAENVARFIDVNCHMMLDLPTESAEQWGALVITSGDQERFAARTSGAATQENVIQFLAFDAENPNSIFSCVRAARENARSVREIISSEMWEQVNTFFLMVGAPAAACRASWTRAGCPSISTPSWAASSNGTASTGCTCSTRRGIGWRSVRERPTISSEPRGTASPSWTAR
jgi:uncharacterized alpha-E superfamily protein